MKWTLIIMITTKMLTITVHMYNKSEISIYTIRVVFIQYD